MFTKLTDDKESKKSESSKQPEAEKQRRTIWTEIPSTPRESVTQERRQNLWLGLTALVSGSLFQ